MSYGKSPTFLQWLQRVDFQDPSDIRHQDLIARNQRTTGNLGRPSDAKNKFSKEHRGSNWDDMQHYERILQLMYTSIYDNKRSCIYIYTYIYVSPRIYIIYIYIVFYDYIDWHRLVQLNVHKNKPWVAHHWITATVSCILRSIFCHLPVTGGAPQRLMLHVSPFHYGRCW